MEPEFWAAVVGAIVGSASGGLITWLLQLSQDNRQTRDRNRALARSLMFKLIKIHSTFRGLKLHLEKSAAEANKNNTKFGWASMRPFAELPDNIHFSPEEMSFVLLLNEPQIFQDVMRLSDIYPSAMGILQFYKDRRYQLTDELPGSVNGLNVLTMLGQDQYKKYSQRFAEIDHLVSEMKTRIDADYRFSFHVEDKLNNVISKRFRNLINLTLTPLDGG